jgi:hypothetical protein
MEPLDGVERQASLAGKGLEHRADDLGFCVVVGGVRVQFV